MVPIEIRKAAFSQLQKMSKEWMGKTPPERIGKEMKLLEIIAYIDGVADLREVVEAEKIENPIVFNIPTSENSTKNREIKSQLHEKVVEINTEIFMRFIKKNPKVIDVLMSRKIK